MALRKKKSHQEENTMRVIWERDVKADDDCFKECTLAGGYSCAYSLKERLKPRYSNELYQCAKSFQDCQTWLDNPFECQRAHCRPWEHSLSRLPINC